MKYLMFDESTPVIFPEHLHHKDIKTALEDLLGEVTSAGHAHINEAFGGIRVSGKSNGLDLYPAEDDEKIIDSVVFDEPNAP